MRSRIFLLSLLIGVVLTPATTGRAEAAQETLRLLKAGDAAYAEKSYRHALKRYEAAEKRGDLPANRRDEIAYRITLALGRTKQWDRALIKGLTFVKSHRQTVWEPRGLHGLAQLYLNAPHNGYRVGSRFYRGENVPKTSGNDSPEYTDVEAQDVQYAREALEAARVLYDAGAARFRSRYHTRPEEIQLDYDLIRTLSQDTALFIRWAGKKSWLPLSEANWSVNPVAPYDLKMPPPQKARFLFAQIRRLASPQERTGNAVALSLLGEALWLQQYHAEMGQWAQQWNGQKSVRVPYPYEKVKAWEVLQQLVGRYPNSSVREQAQFLQGVFLEQEGKFPAAVQTFRALIAARPRSKWVSDARLKLAQTLHSQLTIESWNETNDGKALRLKIASRNVKRVRLTAYRVRLEDLAAQTSRNNADSSEWYSLREFFGKGWKRRKSGGRVAEWSVLTGDQGNYKGRQTASAFPVREAGAYLVEASALGVKSATLVLVSDLTLVQKVSQNGGLFYVTDKRTGQPIAGAHVIARQLGADGERSRTRMVRGTTNAEGMVTLAFAPKGNGSYFTISALAYKANRYALASPVSAGYRYDTAGEFKIYPLTDRSVYRPQQTVFYRQIVMRRQGGTVLPFVSKPVRVVITDPNGKVIHKRITASNRFGSVNGQCVLPNGAALGEYAVSVSLPKQSSPEIEGSGRFRVEEYKKPEFEVTVLPEAERVRLGQPTRAKIQAKYYFGGAVANAKVTYRIYRNFTGQIYRFPKPFDFLYNAGNSNIFNSYRGDVVTQGTARMDANGEAKIEFATVVENNNGQSEAFGEDTGSLLQGDQTFTIEADVQDASRRVISGSGMVKATRHDVAVFLNLPRGYATQGERLDVEIRTLNPSDVPVSVTGTAKILLQPDTPKGKETLVHQETLTTDQTGYALLKWAAAKAGHYRIVFVTQDGAGQTVKSSLMAWVDGAELSRGRFRFQSVFLAVKQPYVQEGEAAKVLLITPEPDCYVLLIREADNEILDKRILRVPGRSLQFDVPITRRDVPNVHLSAVLVRKGEMYRASAEVFVPPIRQFTTVTVQTDKPRYEPGEKATFRLHASDWQGRPVRTELSVSVSDAALQYIQRGYATDIRAFVYGNRRLLYMEIGDSLNANLSPYNEVTPDGGRFRVHRWTLPEGMGRLGDWTNSAGADTYSPRRDPLSINWRLPGEGTFRIRGYVSDGANAYTLSSPRASEYANYSMGGMGGQMGMGQNRVIAQSWAPGDAATTLKPRSLNVDMAGMVKQEFTLGGTGLMEATLRNRFADTAFWTPATVTDANGNATVEVTLPDNLTQWRANAVGSTATAQVGSGETEVVTKKDLLVRLQSPRFLVEQDRVVLSANVLNSLPADARVKVQLDLNGADAEILTDGQTASNTADSTQANGAREVWIDIPKKSERRVDWIVRVRQDGTLRVRMTAQSEQAADAAETTVPVLVHGVEKLTVQSGVLRGKQTAQIAIQLPESRKAGTSELIVQLNPSLAAVMLDALPYLVDYPYGCIEQTMSRFVPCVVLSKSLKDLGYNLDDLKRRATRQAQQPQKGSGRQRVVNSPYTSPNGMPGDTRSPEESTASERAHSPVFDRVLLQKMIAEGLARIAANQNADGGWGWWQESASDPTMSSYVCYGLLLARESGTKIDAKRLGRGLEFVKTVLLENDDLHEQVYAARVLAMEPRYRPLVKKIAAGELFRRRDQLSPYSTALLALALHSAGQKESGRVLLRNLESTAQIDRADGTAHWDETGKYSWRWYNNKVETNAAILQAFLTLQPDSEMPALLVKWLVNNRRASVWNSTRETAHTVYALADYIRIRKELAGDHTVTVNLDNRVQRVYHVTRENALFFDNRLIVPDALLTSGRLPLSITQTGTGNCYYTAYTRTFSQETQLKATGNEIAVRRRYSRLLPLTAHAAPEPEPLNPLRPNPFLTGQYERLALSDAPTNSSDSGTDTRYQRVALKDGEELTSGALLEVELEMESKNDYDYLIFEDIKPAGCEPVEVRSGEQTGKGVYANREMRDQKVVFFLDSLPQGRRTLSYRLRAEMPGQFRSLPVSAYAMYAPAIRALSDEYKMNVLDSPTN